MILAMPNNNYQPQWHVGVKYYSPNRKFSVSCEAGYETESGWRSGKFSVFKNDDLLYEKEVNNKCHCCISDNGMVFGCEIEFNFANKNPVTSTCVFWYYWDDDDYFDILLTSLPNLLAIDPSGKYATFETLGSKYIDADSVFILDIEQRIVLSQITKPQRAHLNQLYFDNNSLHALDINGKEYILYVF